MGVGCLVGQNHNPVAIRVVDDMVGVGAASAAHVDFAVRR